MCRCQKNHEITLVHSQVKLDRDHFFLFYFFLTVSCLQSCADWQVARMGDLRRREMEWHDWPLALPLE